MSASPPDSNWYLHSSWFWVLFAAVTVSVIGVIIASDPWSSSSSSDFLSPFNTGLGVGMAGGLLWWALIERPLKPEYIRGVSWGILTVLIAIPFMIMFWEIGGFIDQLTSSGGRTGPQPADRGVLFYIAAYIVLAYSVVAESAHITFPLGITTGLVLIALRRRVLPETATRSTGSEMREAISPVRSGRYLTEFWILLAAGSTAVGGLIFGPSAAISAAISGGLFWWLLIERPSKSTFPRGVIFGFLTVALALFLQPIVAGLLHIPMSWGEVPVDTVSGPIPSLTELNALLTEAIDWYSTAFFFGGIFTFPIGTVTGLILVALRRRLPSNTEG